MDRLVRAFPLLPGKRQAFHAFAEEVCRRSAEAAQFYNGYGIVRESWHLQTTPAGDLIICCTDIKDLKPAAAAYASARGSFDTWFKQQVLDLCGIDANTQPMGPESRTLFDWPTSA
jgi:folate-dependent tRNA-U54 methylase TrmFO/GidA